MTQVTLKHRVQLDGTLLAIWLADNGTAIVIPQNGNPFPPIFQGIAERIIASGAGDSITTIELSGEEVAAAEDFRQRRAAALESVPGQWVRRGPERMWIKRR